MIKIVTDSAADLPAQEAAELGITVAPLFIQFPEGEMESAEIEPDSFYNRLEAMTPQIPTTAQPSAGIFQEIYGRFTTAGHEVMSIHISSGLSGTVQSAQLGGEGNTAVTVVDSMTLSGGQRFQVMAAALAARAGWSQDEIVAHLDKIRAATEVAFTLETLEYLARGGRIGRVQALAGSLLRIKPVIRVDQADGKYSTVNKGRTLRQTIAFLGNHLADRYGSQTTLWVSIMHGRFSEKAETLAALLQEKLHVGRLETLRISPVLGVHTGPGVVGAAVAPMELMTPLL